MNEIAGVYLDSMLAPLSAWLQRPDVTDIYVNRPHEVWVETLGGTTECHPSPTLSDTVLLRLARQLAARTSQGISRAHPLLAATLPDGSRVQVVAPPATRGHLSLAIRKHVAANLSLNDYTDAFDEIGDVPDPVHVDTETTRVCPQDALPLLRGAVKQRRNILVSGGTSTGKTTFLNALIREIPHEERLILIEDTPELEIDHPNSVGLVAARSALSESDLKAEDLLIAALRMRPDRIILGELRGQEAFTFLRSVNTGHPGSMTTVHADSPSRAVEQLALLVLQSGTRLKWADVIHYVHASIDVFVQLKRVGGKRKVAEIRARRV